MRRFRFTLLLVVLAVAALPAVVIAPPAVAARAALAPGSSGKAVKTLQRQLGITADGHFGPATTRALKRFQRRNGLRASGRVDAATRAVLQTRAPTPTTGGTEATVDAARPTAPAGGGRPSAPAGAGAEGLVEAAASALGVPYKAGGADARGFDCSGLVAWSAAAVGVRLPRSSFAQYEAGRAVGKDAIVAGDLVFFDTAGPGPSDVGIATSASTVISATTHGVREHSIFGDYWGEHFVGARRL